MVRRVILWDEGGRGVTYLNNRRGQVNRRNPADPPKEERWNKLE